MKIKKALSAVMACTVALTLLGGCGSSEEASQQGQKMSVSVEDYTTVDCVTGYTFVVPKTLKENAAPYRDLMVSMAGSDYSVYETASANELAYNNIYQLIDFNGQITCGVYCPQSSFDLSTINGQNAKESVISLIDELAFQIENEESDEPTYFGIDTSTELYSNMAMDMDHSEYTEEDGVQELLIPITTSYSIEIPENNGASTDSAGSTGSSEAATTVQNVAITGYIKLVTPDGMPTRMIVTYGDDEMNEEYSMQYMAESLTYVPQNAGIKTAFDADEVASIDSEMQNAMETALNESGFEAE